MSAGGACVTICCGDTKLPSVLFVVLQQLVQPGQLLFCALDIGIQLSAERVPRQCEGQCGLGAGGAALSYLANLRFKALAWTQRGVRSHVAVQAVPGVCGRRRGAVLASAGALPCVSLVVSAAIRDFVSGGRPTVRVGMVPGLGAPINATTRTRAVVGANGSVAVEAVIARVAVDAALGGRARAGAGSRAGTRVAHQLRPRAVRAAQAAAGVLSGGRARRRRVASTVGPTAILSWRPSRDGT